ncbi:MAG: urate hydroxylase PuuD [Xanthomonadales bacterium]|nr:urate hydroxylase PuuD [Xanthomonadales bacterium]
MHPGFRSRHNHYMTLPVLVLMLVAHVPAITSARFAWAGGAMLAIAAGLAKHVHTRIQRGEGWAVCTLAAVLVLGLSMAISMAGAGPVAPCEGHASEEEITAIFERRCVACHHATGVRPDLSLGIAALEKHYWRVNQRVLAEHSMPPDNVTGMTQQERETLACGFGAPGSRRP